MVRRRERRDPALRRFKRPRPARNVFIGFAVAIGVGAALLALPIAQHADGGADIVAAVFTATSAVCVTGLTVVDTALHWTLFGQIVIIALVQIGGLGVMAFASVIGIALVRRLTLASRLNAVAEARSIGLADVRSVLLGLVKMSALIEGVLTLVLATRFVVAYDFAVGEALWYGGFHAVSSFNSAGFTIFEGGFLRFVDDPWVTLPVAVAVILGSLGFPVLVQLSREFRNPLAWSMNTRLVLVGTVVLVVVGTVFITAVEWSNPRTLGPLDWPAKLLAGFFQSVQTRSGGLNTVPIEETDSATRLGMIILMFIGGGSASTAGGIKITTFGVLLFILISEMRGDGAVNVLGKRLARSAQRQAISVALLGVAVVMAGTMFLLMITPFPLEDLLFESVSAFATAGLSTGITSQLPVAGQLMLVFMMFIGRLGPITFATALALRDRRLQFELPKERPIIG